MDNSSDTSRIKIGMSCENCSINHQETAFKMLWNGWAKCWVYSEAWWKSSDIKRKTRNGKYRCNNSSSRAFSRLPWFSWKIHCGPRSWVGDLENKNNKNYLYIYWIYTLTETCAYNMHLVYKNKMNHWKRKIHICKKKKKVPGLIVKLQTV